MLDTNVLCRLAERGHPDHSVAERAVAALRGGQHELCLVPQVLYEYWVVVSRPLAESGLGMSTADVDAAITLWLEVFTLFRDERGVFALWRELARQHDAKGKSAHDTRLVAAMNRHRLTHLLTFNVTDFRRYPGIEVLDARSFTPA
ncbi:MAG: type II toxin-antitoxin system VapC family toxin [Lacipirellulaceae bacterium]